jgi:mono/diheme cytochrome c family protein
MKRTVQIGVIAAALAVAVPLLVEKLKPGVLTASAMPAWSRKYNANCTLCHTTYPRLNRTGYEFKRLGYRFAWELEGRGGGRPPVAISHGGHAGGGRAAPDATTPGGYVPAPVTESSRAGERLYKELNCSACHAVGKEGGQVGPRLDGVGARRSREFIVGHITDPEEHARNLPLEHPQGATMPATNATGEQIEQLADYLLTLAEVTDVETPRTRLSDYVAVSYAPQVEWENEGGETEREFEKRELIVFAAGPVGRNFSFFVQPLPLSEEDGFMGKFEMMQGLINSGGSRNFVQARFGQIFNLRGAGFGGTDRGLTETLPFVFQPVNGFNPAGLGRGASFEYTAGRTTTFKGFAVSNEAVELEEEEEGEGEEGEALKAVRAQLGARAAAARPLNNEEGLGPELRRSNAYGLVLEQVLGRQGLSGVQFQLAGGYTPFTLGGVRQPSLRFQRYSFFANKTFQDRKNFERVNAIFGLSLLRDNRFLGVEEERRSRGYGYFVEVDTIPVVNRLSLFGRYDQLRPTTLVAGNTLRGGTFGAVFDPHPRYARVLFEYQRLGGVRTANNYRLGFQFNF